MPTVRDAMSTSANTIDEGATILQAAKQLAEQNVGALPIVDEEGGLQGIITDRDIVVKVLAQGEDPSQTKAGDLAQEQPVTVSAEASLEDAVRLLKENDVRRLPVVDGDQVVGMISEADLARALPPEQAGPLMEAIASGT